MCQHRSTKSARLWCHKELHKGQLRILSVLPSLPTSSLPGLRGAPDPTLKPFKTPERKPDKCPSNRMWQKMTRKMSDTMPERNSYSTYRMLDKMPQGCQIGRQIECQMQCQSVCNLRQNCPKPEQPSIPRDKMKLTKSDETTHRYSALRSAMQRIQEFDPRCHQHCYITIYIYL